MLILILGLLACPAATAEPALDGIWKLSYSPSAGLEAVDCLIHLETQDGRLTGRVLGSVPRRGATALEHVSRDADQLRLLLRGATGAQSFQGRVPAGGGKVVLGSYGNERLLNLARLTRTEQTALAKGDLAPARRPLPEPLRELEELNRRVNLLRFQVGAAEDAAAKEELLRQIAEAEAVARAAAPRLHEAVVTWHADQPVVFEAGLALLHKAAKLPAAPERAENWARAVVTAAGPYGRRWHREVTLQVAEALASQPGYGAVALDYARQAEKQQTASDTDVLRLRVLRALTAASLRAGRPEEVCQTRARLTQLEEFLDGKYQAEFPALQVPRLGGASQLAGRAVVLEFFTGSQCRSCAALYPAFDALLKSCRPSDLVLLQYRIHMPGPDPLVNPDAEARWNYYAAAYPNDFRDAPVVLLDGKPASAGGHALHGKKSDLVREARRKYNLYTEIIDRRLEAAPQAKVAVRADRQGDRLVIRVEVRGLLDPGEGKRLRLALAEDTVRHVGPNGLRFHRSVVRAMPGGPAGVALRAANSEHRFDVSLAELREALQRHLDEYAARWPGPGVHLPPDLRNLRVIAFVQDESTREIFQGCQVQVGDGLKGP